MRRVSQTGEIRADILHRNKYNNSFSDGSSSEEEPACNAGDPGSIPGSGRPPEVGNGNSFQYSCLELHGQRSLAGSSPWSRTEMEKTELLALSNTGNVGKGILHKNC